MECKLYNAGTEAVTVLYADKTVLLNPCEDVVLNTGSDKFCIKLQHTKGYGYHGLWYVLNEIFTLEQMRTALIVDGEYVITHKNRKCSFISRIMSMFSRKIPLTGRLCFTRRAQSWKENAFPWYKGSGYFLRQSFYICLVVRKHYCRCLLFCSLPAAPIFYLHRMPMLGCGFLPYCRFCFLQSPLPIICVR